MKTLLNSVKTLWCGTSRTKSQKRRSPRRMTIESLETRTVMSASPIAHAALALRDPSAGVGCLVGTQRLAAQPEVGAAVAGGVQTQILGNSALSAKSAAAPAAASAIQSVITIKNPSSCTVAYQIRIGGSKWQSVTLPAGRMAQSYIAGSALGAEINFDCSFQTGWQSKSYVLSTLDFMGTPTRDTDGMIYVFSLNAQRNGVQLTAAKNALNRSLNASYRSYVTNSSAQFPNLMSNFEVLAGPTQDYNCIAYSLGVYNKWINPCNTIQQQDALNAKYSFRRLSTMDTSVQAGVKKIVLYGMMQNGKLVLTHQARQEADGSWTSKLGANCLIRCLTLEALNGPLYGTPIAVYAR